MEGNLSESEHIDSGMGSVNVDREETWGHRSGSQQGHGQAAGTWAGGERELLPEML